MLDLLVAPGVAPFTCCAILLAMLLVVELLFSFSDGVETMLPTDIPDVLLWLGVGRVPVIFLVVLFLMGFSSIGLSVQLFASGAFSTTSPAFAPLHFVQVAPFSFLGAVLWAQIGGKFLARWMPNSESSAIATADFRGRIATIEIGTARADLPARATFVDEYGTRHYVQVIPETDGVSIPAGTSVVLTTSQGHVYRCDPVTP